MFSEKAEKLAATGVYVFEVEKTLTKTQIERTVEAQFGVKVEKVRTQNYKPEIKRQGRFFGKTKAFKKAFVKLASGTIDLWAPPEKSQQPQTLRKPKKEKTKE